MEILNPTIPNRPRFFAIPSIFTPKYSISAWREKSLCSFSIPNSRRPLYPPFSTCFSLSSTRKIRISAHLGRPTNRRNSLRKKLTQQQVRHNSVIFDPSSSSQNPVHDFDNSENYYSYLDIDSVKESSFSSNYGVNQGTVDSDGVEETKSKLLSESVLWNKFENWVDQYKNDSEFWGIGFNPIFTVFQDSEGNAERVVVNEDEILKRNGFDSTLYKQSAIEDLIEVNSKISHAKFLAREMESGNYVFSKNSSVVKFVVSVKQRGLVNAIQGLTGRPGLSLNAIRGLTVRPGFSLNAIRGLTVRSGLSLKLPRIGILVLCGLFVFWAMKTLFTGGKDNTEYTRLEKEIMRRKIKARKAKEKLETLVKGSVEVIQDPIEPPMVSAEKPRLNKHELMNSIMKAKESSSGVAPQESSSNQATKSKGFDNKIQEIRAMAKRAREIERRDASPGASDGEDDLAVNELSNQEEVVVKQPGEGVVSLPNDLSNDYSGQTRGLNETLMSTSFKDLKSSDTVIGSSDKQISSTSSMKVFNDGESTILDLVNRESGVNISTEVSHSPDALKGQSTKVKKSFRTKPKVILSVKEAREFLSRKCGKQDPNQELQDGIVSAGVAISSLESEKETGHNARKKLGKDKEVSGMTILDGTIDLTHGMNACSDSVLKREEKNDPEAADEGIRVNGLRMPTALGQEANISSTETDRGMNNTSQGLDSDGKVFEPITLGGPSDSVSASSAAGDSKIMKEGNVQEGYQADDLQKPQTSFVHENDSRTTEIIPSVNKENWMEKNFHKLEPVVKKIGSGFRDNYTVAREKVKQELDINCEMIQPKSDEDDGELDWMKDDKLREIVFQVRENELAGHDPFYLMDEEDKLTFYEGLERKVEKENENLVNVHKWLHSNIENLDYGADGISMYDPPEKIIPRWKGPPVDKNPEFLNNFVEQRKTFISENPSNSYIERKKGQNSLQKSKESQSNENILPNSAGKNQITKTADEVSKTIKTVIEGSDGSVKAGEKSGKEYWQHTKKWSRGFLEAYNAETDPEIKSTMKDIGKDLDRWITEKEIEEAADLMNKIPERGRQFIDKKLSKVKREMELFGPQAVMSKYREYAEEKEEDYLWWLDLPFVLCIELYTQENGEQKIGFYSLEMATDLKLDPKQHHVIAFEDPGDCKNLCYIIQAHMEMLGIGNAFVVARPSKDAFREAKANGFSVTVIRKGELRLNVDQTLEEVEEEIIEIGSKIYHDMIRRERSVDISALMKGVFGACKPTKRRRSRKKLKKPSK